MPVIPDAFVLDQTPAPDRAQLAELGILADDCARWVRITCAGAPTATTAPVPVAVQLPWPVLGAITVRYTLTSHLPGEFLRRYAGYRFELLGLLHTLDLGAPLERTPRAYPWPFVWRETGVVVGTAGTATYDFAVQLWHQRAWYRDSPLYAELRWHPEHGERHTLVVPPDYTPPPAALQATARGLSFLRQLEQERGRSGRRADTGDYRAGEGARFRADLTPHVGALVTADIDVNFSTVATQWGHDRRWVEKYCTRFHLNLESLEAEIRRQRRSAL